MGRNYNRLRRLCAFIIGAVFFVSGILKLLDPVGAGLVLGEYMRFFGADFLLPVSKPAGFALAMLETLLGAALMTGLWRRVIAVITLVFLGGFTLLTLMLLLYNPEMDCGCFGEAIHLTHSQTFIKNIVLCALGAVAFTPISRLGRPKKRKYVSFGIVAAASVAFGVFSLLYIPLVDFTEFSLASRLEAAAAGTSDVYDATFIYEKDGQRKSASGKVIVFSVYDVERIPAERWQKIAGLIPAAFDAGYYPLILVPGDRDGLSAAVNGNLPADCADIIVQSAYYADYKTIMTLNRSNGGATYFHDGYLIRKWPFRGLPSGDDLERIAPDHEDEAVAETSTAGHLCFQAFMLLSFAVILFV